MINSKYTAALNILLKINKTGGHIFVNFTYRHTCGSERTIYKSQLSLSTMLVPGIKYKVVRLGANTFTH